MTLELRVEGEYMQFRCLQCQAIIDPLYLGIDQTGDPGFAFTCPVCRGRETLRMHGALGLPADPVFR